MINLQPIHVKVRTELHKRQKVLNREGILFDSPQTDGTGNKKADTNNIFAKSTWIKMTSPGAESGSASTEKLLNVVSIGGGLLKEDGTSYNGYDDIYNSSRNTGENKYRPMPGVKSISVEYKNTLATLRTATINWTIWSFEDLEKLSPFFLKHGKSVILEWGHSYDKNLINLVDVKNIDYPKMHLQFIKKSLDSGGTYDGMMGIITNWTWTIRDDGAIDCTTNISALGVDILKQQVTPTDNIGISQSTDKSDNAITSPTMTFNKYITRVSGILKSGNINGHGIYYPKEKGKGDSTGVEVLYLSWGWIEDNILSRYLGKVNGDGKVLNSIRSIEPYLSPNGDQLDLAAAKAASVLSIIEEETIGEDRKNELAYISTTILNHGSLISPNYKFFVLPGQLSKIENDITSNPILKDLHGNESIPSFMPRASGPSGNIKYGYMRNILFNWQYLVDNIFKNADNISTALNTLFQRMNENVGIWDLQLVSAPDDSSRLKIVDMNATKYGIDILLSKKEPNNTSRLTADWNSSDGLLFRFPVMGKDSIVTGQSLETKLPSSMAVATLYGNSTNVVSPSQMGGNKAFAIGELQNGVDDPILKGLRPGWDYFKFGTASGFANMPLATTEGPYMNPLTGVPSKEKGESQSDEDDRIIKRIDTYDILTFTQAQLENYQSGSIGSLASPLASVYNANGELRNDSKWLYLDIMKFIIGFSPSYSVLYELNPIVPCEISLTLDGISGIYPGNCFHTDYIPNGYKDNSAFQVFSSTQEMDASSWKTTITGKLRISLKNFKPNELQFATSTEEQFEKNILQQLGVAARSFDISRKSDGSTYQTELVPADGTNNGTTQTLLTPEEQQRVRLFQEAINSSTATDGG
jgi:hypothetical protein